MLNNLHVKNLALIDEIEIDFGKGFNVLSGETGAGKSIIIGSLGLALGDRADSEAIRQGAEYALVELSITTDNVYVWNELKKYGIERESDEILIQRRIYPGRSVCRVNGESLTLKELSSISQMVIDICGQRDSLNLLKNTSLQAMLDECGGEELSSLLKDIKEKYSELKSLTAELNNTDEDENLRKRKLDLAQYEIEEIDEARLVVDEDIALEDNYRRYSHSSRINESIDIVDGLCNGEGASGIGINAAISRALREIRSVVEYDDRLKGIESMLMDIEALTSDFGHEVRDYIDGSDYNPEEFNQIQDRLNLINRLKDKYGSSIEKILEYRDEREKEVEKALNYDEYINKLNKRIDALKGELDKLNLQAHNLRTIAAKDLSEKLVNALEDMNFNSCELEVSVCANEGTYQANGYDDIDFMISLNPGEPLKPLSMVASGGELSRIMLAIKSVSASRDNIETLVFDEIDTGISGVTAWKVAGKMSKLAKEHQVICITHQAQIAAFADKHFLIEKKVEDDRSITHISALNNDEMHAELARMMGTDVASEASFNAAVELKNKANETK